MGCNWILTLILVIIIIIKLTHLLGSISVEVSELCSIGGGPLSQQSLLILSGLTQLSVLPLCDVSVRTVRDVHRVVTCRGQEV